MLETKASRTHRQIQQCFDRPSCPGLNKISRCFDVIDAEYGTMSRSSRVPDGWYVLSESPPGSIVNCLGNGGEDGGGVGG